MAKTLGESEDVYMYIDGLKNLLTEMFERKDTELLEAINNNSETILKSMTINSNNLETMKVLGCLYPKIYIETRCHTMPTEVNLEVLSKAKITPTSLLLFFNISNDPTVCNKILEMVSTPNLKRDLVKEIIKGTKNNILNDLKCVDIEIQNKIDMTKEAIYGKLQGKKWHSTDQELLVENALTTEGSLVSILENLDRVFGVRILDRMLRRENLTEKIIFKMFDTKQLNSSQIRVIGVKTNSKKVVDLILSIPYLSNQHGILLGLLKNKLVQKDTKKLRRVVDILYEDRGYVMSDNENISYPLIDKDDITLLMESITQGDAHYIYTRNNGMLQRKIFSYLSKEIQAIESVKGQKDRL